MTRRASWNRRPRPGSTATTRRAPARVAIVTGGASGIGRATAVAFAREGARVVIADIDTAGDRVAREIARGGGDALFVRTDVTRADDVRALVAATRERHGRLDVAVNAAGVEGSRARSADLSDAEWQRVIAINLTGVWHCLREEIPLMLASGGGAIVNVSSVGGLTGQAGFAAYAASKHGVIGLTRSAALEYAADGVRINAVCPSAVETPMLDRVTADDPSARARLVTTKPVGRLATAEEVAEIIVWLCGPSASYIVGQSLPIDGGMLAGQR